MITEQSISYLFFLDQCQCVAVAGGEVRSSKGAVLSSDVGDALGDSALYTQALAEDCRARGLHVWTNAPAGAVVELHVDAAAHAVEKEPVEDAAPLAAAPLGGTSCVVLGQDRRSRNYPGLFGPAALREARRGIQVAGGAVVGKALPCDAIPPAFRYPPPFPQDTSPAGYASPSGQTYLDDARDELLGKFGGDGLCALKCVSHCWRERARRRPRRRRSRRRTGSSRSPPRRSRTIRRCRL